MSILVNTDDKLFNLSTKNTSYILGVVENKYLAHIYWGKKIANPNMNNSFINRGLSFSANEKNCNFSLDLIPQECPTGCGTDYRTPAVSLLFADGSRNAKLTYVSYRAVSGKPALEGLPATYVEDSSEADTLEITLRDELKKLTVILSYSVFEELDVITRNVKVINQSDENIIIEKIMSASVDFEPGKFDFINLEGAWARERHIDRTPLSSGMMKVESRRGSSSHQQNPFIAMASHCADEEHGDVYAMNFVYSGNFEAGVEVGQLKCPRMFMGINGYDFSWKLEPQTHFQAPEVVMVYSDAGFGKMSRIYHKIYRTRLVRGKYRDEIRPILANNWEATYFDFTEEQIVDIAKEAANLGIELFVLDDGWFGHRDNDQSSLGDWTVYESKLPNGIDGMAKKVSEQGIKFGLWFEPEMVSVDSKLYTEHPDWCIHVTDRDRTECRNQLVLDVSRDEVRDYIVKSVSAILDSAPISYVKWDMNRNMTEFGSAALPADQQKELPHRYILNLYSAMEEIISNHPDVLFESCSGGGGRFDPGMLYYMPQTWTSDDTDAVERLFIQYGTSLCYPASSMGAHVSAVPNHQVKRDTSLKMRGDVAMSGNFGYELDLTKFTEEEKAIVKAQIEEYKDLRTFVGTADMYRINSPFEGNTASWVYVSEDGTDVFAAYFRILGGVNLPIERMKFRGLDTSCRYVDVNTGEMWNGDELMNIGIKVELEGDYQSKTWRLKKTSQN